MSATVSGFCTSSRAEERDDALSLPRSSLLVQLEAIRASSTYAAFLRQRLDVARQLTAARAETATRRFQVRPNLAEAAPRFRSLSATITLRRSQGDEPGRLEVRFTDGADLMRQLAEFLRAAGLNREEFFAATEPPK